MLLYPSLLNKIKSGHKLFAVLLDPQEYEADAFYALIQKCNQAHVDLILLGGSHQHRSEADRIIEEIKSISKIPCVLFPGHSNQISSQADALLLLSLLSGRNPEYLIGKHVSAAMQIRESGLEVIPTAYILVDSGNLTSVQYITQTYPIPRHKSDILVSTAVAAEMLGFKLAYLEAGSGASQHVPVEMIKAVKGVIDIPIIVGGGIHSPETAKKILNAGADIIVVGNAIEKDHDLVFDFSACIHSEKDIIDSDG